jgi:hypothetical protein
MIETRSGKYGRNLAMFVSRVLDSIPADQGYRKAFLNELQTYSLEPRKKGTLPGPGCVNELENIENIDINNPKHLAKLIKEGIHLMYQKRTVRKVLYSFLENL